MLKPAHRPDGGESTARSRTLADLCRWLQSQGYAFVTVGPATHAAVLHNRTAAAAGLRDVFGWNLPFAQGLLPSDILDMMRRAGLVEALATPQTTQTPETPQIPGTSENGLLRSTVRFSTLGELIFPHSSFPTAQSDSVFFGPDTYRFAALIRRELRARPLASRSRLLDVGCGTGAGGLVAATCAGSVGAEVSLSDISATALEFAKASVSAAGVDGVRFSQSDLFSGLNGAFDLIVANPPYLNDATQRLYRHGGGQWGEALSIRILREGLARLAPGGRLVLYTGSAIANGVDALGDALRADLATFDCTSTYEEIDPDVFGEELQSPAYAGVDRIAAVSLVVTRHGA